VSYNTSSRDPGEAKVNDQDEAQQLILCLTNAGSMTIPLLTAVKSGTSFETRTGWSKAHSQFPVLPSQTQITYNGRASDRIVLLERGISGFWDVEVPTLPAA
jgi:hypothetical protein